MERLVRNYMITSNDATEEVKAIVSEIVYRTGLLSAVLADCPQEQFTINVLVDFYCERLSDTASVPELLQGIASLIQFNTFNDENALKVAKSIFASVNVQSFQQTSRHYVFQIFDRMLKDHLTALKQMGQDFVVGFIQAMDGEKDPRNLLLAFSLIKLIIHEFDISQRVELLFEVTFCYFPITFKPPPDDPYGITADDLKIALSNTIFCRIAMPLLLEKLTSSSGNAKKDSMETLAACAPVYGANSIVPYLEPLWEYLKDEIINATDDSFENIALETIKNIVATLSSGIIDRMDHLQQFLKTIVTECMENLKEPELKLAKPCGRILMYCAMASDPSFNIVTLATLRVLIQQYKESELATRKKGILDVLRELITASKNLYGSIDKPSQNIDTDFVTPLSNYKYDYMEIFSSALLNQNEYNELRLCGLRGLYEMILLRQFFNDDEIGVILQYFNRAILEETEQEIVDEALKFLANIAKCKSEIVLEVTLPVFLDNLPCNEDEMKIDNIHGTNLMKANFVKTLDALSELAIEPILFEAYVPQILKKLDFASSNFSTAGIDLEYSESLLHSLHSLLLKKTNHSDISRYVDTLVPHLLTKSIGPSLYDKPEVNNTIQSVFCEEKIIKIVAGIISVITKNLNVSEQSIFISHIFEIFVKGNLNLNYLGFSDQEKSLFMTTFNPLSVESSFQQQNLSLLFTAAVGSCRNEVPYPVPNISEFLSNIVRITLYTKNELHQRSLAQLAASILNKWNQENELKQFVETKILGELRNHFTSSSTGNEIIRQISLDTFIWLTKALILRTYPLGYECVSQITSQFSDPILGKRASEGFEVLIGESDFLNKASFAVIRILYKQKFFNYCMPILAEGFKMSSDEVKHNYLIALSHLLRNIPKQVLLSELPSLFPLLIHSLSLPDAELKSSTIDTFYIISGDASRIISEHVSSLVPLLLSSTKPDKGNTMQVRISALQCLGILPDHVSFDVLFPFKSKILRELSTALDDKKRLVRKQAVDCRSKWFLFTGPRADN